MMTYWEGTLQGEKRPHSVRLRFYFEAARPAPSTSNPDSPSFSDPGDPGCAEITTGFVILVGEDGKALRERAIPKKTLDRMKNDSALEEFLYEQEFENNHAA